MSRFLRAVVARGRATTAIVVALVCLLGPIAPAMAAEDDRPAPQCTREATPGGLVLDCRPGFETPHDRLTIYSEHADDESFDPFEFREAVWVFDAGARGRASLVIHFHDVDGLPTADLYDDHDGDGAVALVVIHGRPVIFESTHPTVRVTSRDGWWVREGRPSYNLDIRVDGRLQAAFGASLGIVRPHWEFLRNDGRTDYRIHVRDANQDGRPELEWRQFYPPFPESPALSGHYRTEIVRNPEDDEVPIEGSIFWPYLGRPVVSTVGPFTKGYGESSPPIQVDWAHGRIHQVAEFVASRANPGSYFIYSINRVPEGTTTAANFENPFAFYDFAEADDGWPDTTIRVISTLPNEAAALPNVDPINILMYTWDHDHSHNWRYSVNVVGRQQVDETIEFPDFTVKSVPPEQLPHWATSQRWQAATFVEVMKPYWTSEHVYEYTLEDGAAVVPFRYLTGLDPDPPTELFESIDPDFRGEYTLDMDRPIELYLSPVDHRLHMVGATSGVWNMGEGRQLRYRSLNGEVIDHWLLEQNGLIIAEVYQAADQLIYTSGSETGLGTIGEMEALPRLVPPRNHEEWVALRDRIDAAEPSWEPDDLESMFAALVDDPAWLPGMSVRDLGLTADGFRFVLDAGVGTATPSLPGVDGPGQYVVSYRNGSGYAAAPFRRPTIEVLPVSIIGGDARVSETATISVRARNAGPVDAPARLVVEVRRPVGPWELVDRVRLNVPAKGVATTMLEWTPPGDGTWLLRSRLDFPARDATVTRVSVAGALEQRPIGILGTHGDGVALLPLALLVLASAAFVAARYTGLTGRSTVVGPSR